MNKISLSQWSEREVKRLFLEKCKEDFYNVAVDDLEALLDKPLNEIRADAYCRDNAILLAYSYFRDYKLLESQMGEIYKIARSNQE
ncbi:hypothetical protein [Campylobacter helveticus]|uniref:hypothetical protein n=1 Tax=Campylobacter helveticus TaxID=28898 RepID=UPI00214A3C0B|nr:hypothetical protein [Campylobacter helveticus]MCR2061920.1 hypothetical protein [Campylobacter helveticus]